MSRAIAAVFATASAIAYAIASTTASDIAYATASAIASAIARMYHEVVQLHTMNH